MKIVEMVLQKTSLASFKQRSCILTVKNFLTKTFKKKQIDQHFGDLISLLRIGMYRTTNNPARIKLVRYLGLYLRFIISTSLSVQSLYISGTHNRLARKYRSSRKSIYTRYKHVFPKKFYRQVHLSEAIYVACMHRSLNYLIVFLKEMFATVNFFKHRFLLYYLRAAFVNLGGNAQIPGVRGLFIKFRGKLAKAGNSRRQRFLLTHGQISTNYADSYLVEKFQIKTFTGAIGCTIIMCCN